MQRRIHTGGSGSSPTSAGYLKLTLSSKASSGKASDEGTTLAMQIPGDTQPRTPVLICDRNRRHRMGQFCQWRIERHFIAAEVILLAQRAGLYRDELAGAQQREPVLLLADLEFDGRRNHRPQPTDPLLVPSASIQRERLLRVLQYCERGYSVTARLKSNSPPAPAGGEFLCR